MATENSGFLNWLMNQFSNRMNPFGQGGLNRGIGMGIGAITGNPLLGMALGNINFGNLGSTLGNAGRGIGTSIGRMFDNDPRTGFGNNPTAPWNWRSGPSNVPAGHPDFVGPMQGGINASANNTYGVNQSDQGSAPPTPSPVDGNWGIGWIGGLGNQVNGLNAGQRFNANMPGHWRRIGRSSNWGPSGGGIDGFAVFANDRGTIQQHNYIK